MRNESSDRSRSHNFLYCVGVVLAAVVLGPFASAGIVPITVIKNAKIWTGGTEQPEAQALAIAGDRILVVGSDAEVGKFEGPDTNVIDAKGRRILPGFNDAHVHFFAGGSALTGPALRLSKSQEEFRRTLAAFARGVPKGRWITGGNWDHENWVPAELPTRQLIDDVTADWPVLVSRWMAT